MLWLERASCRLDRDEEGLWLTEEGARAEKGGVAVSLRGPPTNSLCFAVRASGHQHRGQVRSLPLQSMQEQRHVQPGPGGAAPLRLPPRLQGTQAAPTFRPLGGAAPR